MADNNELERTLWATADKLRNNMDAAQYKHVVCKSATIDEVCSNSHVLMPGRYMGTEEEIDDGIPSDEKMKALTTKLAEQFTKGVELGKTIRENLKGIG